ncbi:MAG: Unknown protein [uncultured Thiotrichaceae bacterium]|uniref:Uncharacterized protein n=1 Tax=uncultured Thiotrichaceae bacterium TaxID=298394 RepID=A0A6S6SGD0_9GAMM|nr:MAG: Unknown protein [uncultured Thiotrichaceae bacterium]
MLITEKKYIDIGIPFSYWDKEIEVICPKCGSTALIHSTDTEAKCICSFCGKTEHKYLEQPQYAFSGRRTGQIEVDPFFHYKLALIEQTSNGNIWVYNADQLKHLKSYISAKLREKKEVDKYFSYYISYFHKLPAWVKSSKYRDTILKKIAILEKKAITKPNNKTPLDIANDIKESFFYRWNWNNRSWKFLERSKFLNDDYNIMYYPSIKEKNVIIKKIENGKLLISKSPIENSVIATEKELIAEISLKHTTKGHTFKYTKRGKPTKYYSISMRKLSNEIFSAKELLTDMANMNIGEGVNITNDMLNFEEGDYIFMFTESNSSHPDFAPTPKDETHKSYGFSESAIKKLLKSINYVA